MKTTSLFAIVAAASLGLAACEKKADNPTTPDAPKTPKVDAPKADAPKKDEAKKPDVAPAPAKPAPATTDEVINAPTDSAPAPAPKPPEPAK